MNNPVPVQVIALDGRAEYTKNQCARVKLNVAFLRSRLPKTRRWTASCDIACTRGQVDLKGEGAIFVDHLAQVARSGTWTRTQGTVAELSSTQTLDLGGAGASLGMEGAEKLQRSVEETLNAPVNIPVITATKASPGHVTWVHQTEPGGLGYLETTADLWALAEETGAMAARFTGTAEVLDWCIVAANGKPLGKRGMVALRVLFLASPKEYPQFERVAAEIDVEWVHLDKSQAV